MCYKSLGISAVAPNSETQFISESLMKELQERFKFIIVHYDNDRAGKYNMVKIRKQYPNLYYYFIPNHYKAKDLSDFYKKYGRAKTIEVIKNQLLTLKQYGKTNS